MMGGFKVDLLCNLRLDDHMRLVLFIISIILVACGCVTSKEQTYTFEIENTKEYYASQMIRCRQLIERYRQGNNPILIFELDNTSLIIEKTGETYRIIRHQRVFNHMHKLENDSLIPIYTSKETKFKMYNYGPLNKAFDHLEEPSIYYNIANSGYKLSNLMFCLYDSKGVLKFIANQDTFVPTKEYYKKKFNIELPIDEQLLQILIFHFIFEKSLKN